MGLSIVRTAAASILALIMAASAVPVAAQNEVTRPQVKRPTGSAWEVLRKNCISCHGIDDYAYYALDKAGWQSLLATKHSEAKAELSDKDRDVLLEWLVATLGPNSTPFPRSYVPPVITTFFTDAEGNALLNSACTRCHNLDRVNVQRNTPERWRVITLRMREKGTVLTDIELEQLVEWLSRVKGANPV